MASPGSIRSRLSSSIAGPSRLGVGSGPKIAKLPHRSVLEVSGPDARKFLNGQTCKNVEAGQGGYSGFLNASGRVLHTVFIFLRSPDTYLISHDSPSTHPAPLQTLLPPFRLRSKVRIKDVSDQWDVYSTFNDDLSDPSGADQNQSPLPQRTWKFGSGGASESQWSWPNGVRDLGLKDDEVGCWDLRAGMGMRQILVPKGDTPSLASTHDQATLDEYHLHRMLLDLPEGPDEIVPGSALPLESCMDIHGGVDFRKGCYLGQELTVRTYHTGATRKRILPIRLFPLGSGSNSASQPISSYLDHFNHSSQATGPAGLQPAAGIDITFHPPASSATQRPKPAGKILSLHPTYSSVGLGLVRLEYAEKTWWSEAIVRGIRSGMTVEEWSRNAGGGKLSAKVGGEEWGVYVGQGEAYGEALEEMRKQAE